MGQMRRVSFVLISLAVGCGGGKASQRLDAGDDGGIDGVVETDASDAPPPTPLEHVSSTFPANGATGVCTDAPLRMVFDTPPAVGTSGTIRVYEAGNPGAPVDMIDLGAPLTIIAIAGRNYFYRPVVVTGNEAYVYLRKVLQPGGTYFV